MKVRPMNPDQITSRIGSELFEYRRQIAFERKVKVKDLDIEVWQFYRQHHPIENQKTEPKE